MPLLGAVGAVGTGRLDCSFVRAGAIAAAEAAGCAGSGLLGGLAEARSTLTLLALASLYAGAGALVLWGLWVPPPAPESSGLAPASRESFEAAALSGHP